MARAHDYQPAFNAGELSPRLAARTDVNQFKAGLATCENLIPLVEGGVTRRPGSRYIAEVKSSSVKGRLKPFEFSTTQAYMIEMGDSVLRFYRHQAQISVPNTDAAVTNGTFPSGITDWDDRSTGGAGNQISHDATNDRLTLETNGTAADDIGWAEQDITTTNTNVEHVIKFQVIGAPGDRIEFQVGSTSTGAETLAAVTKEVGYHCVSFTPTTSPFYIQFRNRGNFRNKDVQIDNVSLIDNAGVEVDSPFPLAVLYQTEGPQSADELYLFNELYPTHKLQRFGHTTWSLVEVEWEDGPYLDENETTTTLTPSAATGLGINLTLSSAAGVNGGQGWLSTDVGRLVRYKKSAAWGYAIITSITSTTVAVADVRKDFEATPTAQTTFRLGAWSGTTGYPLAAAFFEQRLYVANTATEPQGFWASQTADFQNFKPDDDADTVEADDALDFTLAANDVNAIRWMGVEQDVLVFGTTGGEWVPSSSGIVITPLDVSVRRQTAHGCARVMPVSIDHTLLFIQRASRRVREFGFAFEVDGFVAPDLTRLAGHITYGGVTELAYQQEPESLVWMVRNDGQLLSMTYRRQDEQVVGWARHILGGSFAGADAVVESVAIIPGADGSGQVQSSANRDEVWVIVKRTINGATKRFIEVLERPHEDGHAQEDAYYADSCITLDNPITITNTTAAKPVVVTAAAHGFSDGDNVRITEIVGMTELNGNTYTVNNKTTNTFELTSAEDGSQVDGTGFTAYVTGGKVNPKTTAISGLDHLEGEEVMVWGDGAVQGPKTVASGAITLDQEVSVAQIGLAYTHTLKTLRVGFGTPVGSGVGKIKRMYGVTFLLLNSHTLSFGPSLTNLQSIDFREVGQDMDEAVPLFTGEKYVSLPGGWTRDARLFIQSSDPAPFTLLAIAPELDINPLR